MALTALQQLQLLNGEVKPPSTDLRTLVKISAYIESVDFSQTYKTVGDDVLAQEYLQKRFAMIRRVFSDQADAGLFRIMVSILGASSITPAQIMNASDEQWETFVGNQIVRCMEILGDVRRDEKTAYDNIV